MAAVAAIGEAVEMCRRLTIAHPGVYEADLAKSLERLNRLTSGGAQAPRRRFRFRAAPSRFSGPEVTGPAWGPPTPRAGRRTCAGRSPEWCPVTGGSAV